MTDLPHLTLAFAKLLLAQAQRFPDAAEALKQALVTAAKDKPGKVTDSEISLRTGLQRRDVARLKSAPPPATTPNPLARIVGQWRSDPKYRGRDLPRTGSGSFDELARSVHKDMHPRTFLDGLLMARTVALTDDDQVRLIDTAYRPVAGSDDQRAYLDRNVADHLMAALTNTQTPQFFERAVHYNRLTADQVAELHAQYSQLQMQVLEQINTLAADMQSNAPADAAHRFRAGGYFWAEPEKDQTP